MISEPCGFTSSVKVRFRLLFFLVFVICDVNLTHLWQASNWGSVSSGIHPFEYLSLLDKIEQRHWRHIGCHTLDCCMDLRCSLRWFARWSRSHACSFSWHVINVLVTFAYHSMKMLKNYSAPGSYLTWQSNIRSISVVGVHTCVHLSLNVFPIMLHLVLAG